MRKCLAMTGIVALLLAGIPASAALFCTKDSDCSANQICIDNACVLPPQPQSPPAPKAGGWFQIQQQIQKLTPIIRLPPATPTTSLKDKAQAAGGCWKTDQLMMVVGKATDPITTLAAQVDLKQLATQGSIEQFILTPAGSKYITDKDQCVGPATVTEHFCVTNPTTKAKFGKSSTFTCPTGEICGGGQCISSGCVGNQKPFLKIGDAQTTVPPDSPPQLCVCPKSMIPMDLDSDGNSETCMPTDFGIGAKLGPCSQNFDPSKFPDAKVETIFDLDTGKPLKTVKYCAQATGLNCDYATLQYSICDANDIMSKSATPCPFGTFCSAGGCVPGYCDLNGVCIQTTQAATCDASQSDPSPEGLGKVLLNYSDGGQELFIDSCAPVDAKLGYSAAVYNAVCPNSCMINGLEPAIWLQTPCPDLHQCQGGVCLPLIGDMKDDGIDCTQTPNDPKCQGVNCRQTPNDPKCLPPPEEDPGCIPEKPKAECSDDTDPQQKAPVFGELLFGTGKVESCNMVITASKKAYPDACVWHLTRPYLKQARCEGNVLAYSIDKCSALVKKQAEEGIIVIKADLVNSPYWDCDPEEPDPELNGICRYYGDTLPSCTATGGASDLTQANTVKGVTGFGLPFTETDTCSGVNNVKKWFCEGPEVSAQGHHWQLVSCSGSAPICEAGKCVALVPDDKSFCEKNPKSAMCVDTDLDGIFDAYDNCPNKQNPDQKDSDKDGIGDVCDKAAMTPDDCDADDIFDPSDNCTCAPNADQADSDGDGIGNVCDENIDCTKTPDHPWCAKNTLTCVDTDFPTNPFVVGTATVLDAAKTVMQEEHDFCIEGGTAVAEMICSGQGGKIFYKKYGCSGLVNPATGKAATQCNLGRCE